MYLSGDKTSKRVLVLQADIFAFTSGRHTSICDFFASKGYYVIMPDYFEQDRVGADFVTFIKKHPIEDIQRVLDQVYEKHIHAEVESVMMMGFCLGCWVIFQESQRDVLKGKFKFGVNFHPSVQIEGMFGRETDVLCRAIKHPMMLVPTNGDHEAVQPGSYLQKEASYDVEIFDYTHQEHGFVSQGDTDKDEKLKKDVLFLLDKAAELMAKY